MSTCQREEYEYMQKNKLNPAADPYSGGECKSQNTGCCELGPAGACNWRRDCCNMGTGGITFICIYQYGCAQRRFCRVVHHGGDCWADSLLTYGGKLQRASQEEFGLTMQNMTKALEGANCTSGRLVPGRLVQSAVSHGADLACFGCSYAS